MDIISFSKAKNVEKQFMDIEVNVKKFGAKGNGETEDTVPFKDAVSYLKDKGGGKIVFPKGEYIINGEVELISNLHIEVQKGAVISPSEDYLAFWFPSYEKGYNGGLSNIRFDGGGTIKGDISKNKYITFACHHTSNLTVKDLTLSSNNTTGHIFDLCGCDNVVIEDIVFLGNNSDSGQEHKESIQIDYSGKKALTVKSDIDKENVDGLPSKNIYINRCIFSAIYNEGSDIEYASACPTGSHSSSGENLPYENIYFTNNLIVDPLEQTSDYGVIHFMGIRNLKIKDNRFVSTNGIKAKVITVTDQKGSTINEENSSRHVSISGNIIDGFKSGDNLIRIRGANDDVLVGDVSIKNNVVNKSKMDMSEIDCINLHRVSDVNMIGNIIDNMRSLSFLNKTKNVIIRDNVIRKSHILIESEKWAASEKVMVVNNYGEELDQAVYGSIERLICSGNVFELKADKNAVTANYCVFLNVHDNYFKHHDSTDNRIVYVGDSTKSSDYRGIVHHNYSRGFNSGMDDSMKDDTLDDNNIAD